MSLASPRVSAHRPGWGAFGMEQWRGSTASRLVVLVVLGMSTAGCELVGGIFKAGVGAGVILVVLFLAGMAFLASKFRAGGPR